MDDCVVSPKCGVLIFQGMQAVGTGGHDTPAVAAEVGAIDECRMRQHQHHAPAGHLCGGVAPDLEETQRRRDEGVTCSPTLLEANL